MYMFNWAVYIRELDRFWVKIPGLSEWPFCLCKNFNLNSWLPLHSDISIIPNWDNESILIYFTDMWLHSRSAATSQLQGPGLVFPVSAWCPVSYPISPSPSCYFHDCSKINCLCIVPCNGLASIPECIPLSHSMFLG